MDATDNPDVEAHEDVDTLDVGTGASADEGSEEADGAEETESLTDNPLAYIEAMEGVPEDVKSELRKGYLRQADYTKKTQSVSDDRRRLEEQRSVVDQILLSQKESKTKESEKEVSDTPPDLASGATPEDVIDYYVNRAVQEKLKALGIGDTVDEIRPLAAQQRVVKAYQEWAENHPDVDHETFAMAVGQVLDSDPDLTELAQSNPAKAVRIAAKVARANTSAAKTVAKSKKRRAAAPVASRKGTVVSKKKRESALEAATRALREQGVNI